MRSLNGFGWLLKKEWRALTASRAFWLMLLAMAPLVGLSFSSAVRSYSELSVGVGEALNPLIGIWAPTFSAAELVAVFLLPFVAISLVTGDRQSGALKLELQQPLPATALIATKALVLLAGWSAAMLIPASSLLLWHSYGGGIYLPEMAALLLGHFLNAGLTIALATVAGALADSQAYAAIITLAVTAGTWLLNFAGSIQGGWWERAAAFTPSALVAQYQHGLVTADATIIPIVLTSAGLLIGAICYQLGLSLQHRLALSLAVCVIAAGAAWLSVPKAWDLSEGRINSFPLADEQSLTKGVHQPLTIEVHLAAEDPRRQDLEAHALGKLRRLLPGLVSIHYQAATSTGLFEQSKPGYGEIWYQMAGRRIMSRSTTAEGALEAVYDVAQMKAPPEDETVYRGHPLITQPKWAALAFYGIWPFVLLAGFLRRNRLRY